jgi:Cysteine-rich CPCC
MSAGPYACPCCGYLTLDTRGEYQICQVCFWEDDGQDDRDADTVRGGPNGTLSLTRARRNYTEFGASERTLSHVVRPPHDEEHPLHPDDR